MGGSDDLLKAAEQKLQAASLETEAKRKQLLAAQEAMTKLCRRDGLGNGRTAPKPAAEIKKVAAALAAANAAALKAAEAQRACEEVERKARAKVMAEHPEQFIVKVELPVFQPVSQVAEQAPEPAPSGPPRTTVALIFPGQGSQYVNMLGGLKDNPTVKDMITEATDVLGWDILETCLNGPEEKLAETDICQPCVYLAGVAGLVKLREERPEVVDTPGSVAGLSLGEYTALVAAEVITFRQGMELVKVRSTAMSEAASVCPQAMLSVFGVDQETMDKLCKEQAQATGEVCQIANLLFPRGFSCSGTVNSIGKLKTAVEEAGAMQAKLLKTSGAFHTDLMKPAQEQLQTVLDKLLPEMKPPKCDIYMNVTGKKVPAGTPPKDFVPLLAKQLCSTVQWEASIQVMIADGMTEFYEVGPMKQLRAMMKRIDMNMWSNTKNIEV